MRILPKDLSATIARGLMPLYFVWGEEPLQRMEILDTFRAHAKNQGYTERELVELVTPKDEDRLWMILDTPSLFAQQRLIECRLKEGKNTKKIQELISKIADRLPPQTVIVILFPDKLDAATLKTNWFSMLERHHTTVFASPIPPAKFLPWLQERAKRLNLSFTQEALVFLAERTEGNLVAANQSLEKIALLYTKLKTPLTIEDLAPLMAWESRHSVFDLADALLQGAYTRTYRILESLRNEGIEPSLICWAITREVRNLIPLAETLGLEGRINDSILDTFRIWKQRRALVTTFLQKHSLSSLYNILIQAKDLDILIKTENTKKVWQALQNLCYSCCRGEQNG